MHKAILIALAAVLFALPVSANAKQEKQVTRTIWEISDFPDLEKKALGVCESKLSLSDKLRLACQSKTFPSVTKAGAFRNTGIGAELNALMRQAN